VVSGAVTDPFPKYEMSAESLPPTAGGSERSLLEDAMMMLKIFLASVFFIGFCGGAESIAATPVGSAQTASAGGVTVKVTYLSQTKHESRFSVALDTHSANLDSFDLTVLSTLRDDTGIQLKPTAIENKGSGHHREAILTFPRPSLNRKWLELVIKDLAGERERIFRWQE
jgi:hypothetical protein